MCFCRSILLRLMQTVRRACVTICRRLLALLVHARLRRHRVRALRLLLLLQVRLVLHGLLIVGRHAIGLLVGVAWHVSLWDALRHWWWSGM